MNTKLTLLATGLFAATGLMAQGEQQRPNILFCIADDASLWTLGAYGGTFAKTPAIDKLAAEGVMFNNAYTSNPKSSPARAMLLTGKYSWQLKQGANHYFHFPEEFAVYPDLLEQSGYAVGLTGKGWGPGTHSSEHNPAGKAWSDIKMQTPAKGINTTNYSANFEKFLDDQDPNKPFCFWLGCFEPHRFYEKDSWKRTDKKLSDVVPQGCLPDNDIVRGDMLDYAVEVEWYDKHIGEAVAILEEKGMLDNTLIIITSDHGMPFPRIKGQIYDEGFRIPFIAYWKGKIKAGTQIDDFIAFHDVAPTFMEVAGLEPHPQMSGKSFVDVMTSQKSGRIDPDRDHVILFKERHDVGRASEDGINLAYPVRGIRNEDFLYVMNYEPTRWPAGNPEYGYRNCDGSPTKDYLISLEPQDADYKFYEMAFDKRPRQELYNMRKDPNCLKNLAYDKKYAKVVAEMHAQMEKELKESGDLRMEGKGDVYQTYEFVGKPLDYTKTYTSGKK